MTAIAQDQNADEGSAVGSSFYAAMRILPRRQREAMFQVYSFCSYVDDIADSDEPRDVRAAGLQRWSEDIDALYQAFMPLQIAKVVDFADPIEGVPQVIAALREQGIKIGSCSGYPRAVMAVLAPAAAQRGYAPDYWVATDDLAAGGRPGPWMALQNVIALGIDAVAHCVKVDDAVPGIAEGLNAGMWSVGLALSGNEFGATWQEYRQMPQGEIERRRTAAADKLYAAGAHYVIDTLAQLPGVIADINRRLANGERP